MLELALWLGCCLTLLLSFVTIPFTVGVIARVGSRDDSCLIGLSFAFQPGVHLVLKIGFWLVLVFGQDGGLG